MSNDTIALSTAEAARELRIIRSHTFTVDCGG